MAVTYQAGKMMEIEVDVSGITQINTGDLINDTYVVLCPLEETVDWGKHSGPVNGATYRLLVTTDPSVVISVRKNPKRHKTVKMSTWNKPRSVKIVKGEEI